LNSRPRQEVPAPVTSPAQKSTPSDTDPSASPGPATNDQPNSPAVVPAPVPTPSQTPVKSDPVPTPVNVVEKKPDPPAAKPEPKKAEPTITAAAAQYKGQIEAALADRSMSSRIKVSAASNTIMLTGKLRPAEHSSLLHFMRNAPASVHVVDEISYDDTPLPASQNSDNSGHPIPSNGNAAVHVLTNVIGAKATVFGPSGRSDGTCLTPCSFNDLAPGRYSLQVQKDGYLQVQTALELKTGDSQDQKILLEALAKGIYVGSRPAGADVFINGDKQAGQTPVTLPLAPGSYNLVLRLEGYEPYVGQIQVKDNVQTALDLELKPRAGRVAWAQVDSTPSGAEILVDGISTGQFSPARVQIPTGTHMIGLHLKGYELAHRGIQASEGGTVNVNATLQTK
jgi:hypothetical protein